MGRTACTEPQCLYEGALYFYFTSCGIYIYIYILLPPNYSGLCKPAKSKRISLLRWNRPLVGFRWSQQWRVLTLSLTTHADDVTIRTVDPVRIEPEVLGQQSDLYTIVSFHYEILGKNTMKSHSQLSNTSDITHSWHRKSACDSVPVIPPARWNRISVRAEEIERRR